MNPSTLKYQQSKMNSAEPACYEDEYCKLTANTLTLKKYFFPTGSPKQIPISEIHHLFYKKQHFPDDLFQSKDWGITLTPIWWGLDIARSLQSSNTNCYNVVVDTGTKVMKGFTVTNIHEFLNAMNVLIGYSKIIPNTLPESCLLQFFNKNPKQKGQKDGKKSRNIKGVGEAFGFNPREEMEKTLGKEIKDEEMDYSISENRMNENTGKLEREHDFDSVSNFSSEKSNFSSK